MQADAAKTAPDNLKISADTLKMLTDAMKMLADSVKLSVFLTKALPVPGKILVFSGFFASGGVPNFFFAFSFSLVLIFV